MHPSSRDQLHHPGVEAPLRHTLARVEARDVSVRVAAGTGLSHSIAAAMERLGAEVGVFALDGLCVLRCDYVMPAGPRDASHVAWYSDTRRAEGIVLDSATVIAGRKDGAWFLHCHALWNSGGPHPGMGHLLCPDVVPAEPFDAPGQVMTGATLTVQQDLETNFPLFTLSGQSDSGNAALLTIRPHEDLRGTIEAAARACGLRHARIAGIGSIIGARFAAGRDMASPLSEIVVLPGSTVEDGRCRHLNVACVDMDGVVYTGDLKPGGGPVCITAEIALLPMSPA